MAGRVRAVRCEDAAALGTGLDLAIVALPAFPFATARGVSGVATGFTDLDFLDLGGIVVSGNDQRMRARVRIGMELTMRTEYVVKAMKFPSEAEEEDDEGGGGTTAALSLASGFLNPSIQFPFDGGDVQEDGESQLY